MMNGDIVRANARTIIAGVAMTAALAMASGAAAARDCRPVETAPGVLTAPPGCATLGREALPPRQAAPGRPGGGESPTGSRFLLPDGTEVRVHGRVGVEWNSGPLPRR
jgi:hypothetical protein